MKRLNKKHIYITLRHRQCVLIARGKAGGELGGGGKGQGGIRMERDFAWSDGCTMRYTDDVLLSCTLETMSP